MKVLILDSREEDRHTLAGIVASRGHSVVSSQSGGDALKEISAGGFDLVFCGEDKNGPGAPAFVRALRKLPGMISTPCYAAVRKGYDPEDERLLLDVGVTGVVEKPYDPRTILKVIEDSAGDSGQLALPRVSPGAMGDDTFVERYTDRLFETLENKVRELVRMRGSCGKSSSPSSGTCAETSAGTAGGRRGSTMAARERPRVMVVDDEELILRALERAMRRDADVIGLPAAERAIEHLQADSDFDWIISDLNMPGMSGLDFFRKLKELNPGLAERFVLLSGGAVDQDQAQAVHNLHIPVFEKPINFEELKAHIRKLR
jgi:CheY-like chemotaxis protein